ncbi:CHAT domain-containing protein, partial [Dapis sp. BLCC M172]
KERGSGRVGKGGVGERGSRGDGEIGRGKGGDIILEAGNNINTTTARIYSGADDGDTGNINIIADGAIEIGQIDLASGFIRERLEFNNNFTLIPVPKGEATQGTAGNIIISSKNSTIDTSADRINSRSPDGSGDIIIEATGNITTGKLEASALNQEKPTTGGNIEIISRQGEINATKPIETFSERGEGGSVALNAEGHIHTGSIRSEGMQKGGDIEIESRSQNSIEIIGNISSYSTEGTAGNITLRSPGDINLQGIRSDGMQQGGRIKVESETGNIDATGGEIDSFSDQGTGGNVEINASESVNLGNVSSFGMTESGNLTIQSQTAQVNTGNVTTQAPAGSSGNIIINAEEVGTGNLSSIGTTSAGEINVAATDGSIQTYAIEISSDGSIGSLRLQATEDIATEDIDQNAGAGDANIEINSGGDQTTGGINQTADGDTNNTQNAGGNISGDVNQNAGNN